MAKTLGDITTELTDRVLSPARAKADDLIREAQVEAERILAAADAEAGRIREAAAQESANLRRQMEADLETAARNFLLIVEERLEAAIVNPVIEGALKPLLSDREFLEKMILELLAGYGRHGGREHHIEILLPAAQQAELEAWFLERFKEKISQPLEVRFTDKITFGFKIGVAGTGTHVNFSDGLLQVFSEFCSPRFRKYFFPRQES
jgi:V/A-type H+/Na+-transporting ATPase subunit E